MLEQRMRSLIKAISWRITGTIDTILISWIITGHFTAALSIGGVEVVSKMTLYYFHERLWDRINFGRRLASQARQPEELSHPTPASPHFRPEILRCAQDDKGSRPEPALHHPEPVLCHPERSEGSLLLGENQ